MKKIFLLILAFVFSYIARAQQAIYYVVADQDDWQLFMSGKLNYDLFPTLTSGPGGKVIVITLTAGDEGYGSGSISGEPTPYYLSKEKGAIYSSKFARDITNPSIPPFNETYPLPAAQTVSIGGKSVIKYYYGRADGYGAVVNYFLRLPDGGQLGDGFPTTGNKSLKRLKNGNIPNITSVDGLTTYTWGELLNTIYGIIAAERGSDLQVTVNKASLDNTINPNDNSDHFYSSTAAQEAIANKLWIGINEFVMDYSSTSGATLSNEEYERATAAFGFYNWSLIKDRYPSKLTSITRAWLPKESFVVIRTPIGSALPITLLSFSGSLKGNNVLLEWSTSAEVNSKEFQIERSTDGINYRKLHTTPAAGFSTTVKNYSYLDNEATDLNYYRLKMVDLDGYTKQSDVVIVKNNGITQGITSVTNPFKDYINIRFAKIPKGKVSLRLIDLTGKLISASEVYNPLSSIIRFDYNKALSKGLYLLQVENDGAQYGIKLVKE